nr:hypothetical protein [Tanacetum cinerariifolium]
MSIKINKKRELQQLEQAANLSTHTFEPSRRFRSIYYDDDDDDDDEERTIHLRDIISQLPPSIVITTSLLVLPTFEDPEDSLIMRNDDLSTIPKKESNEFIKSSVEDLDPIPSESEDTSGSEKDSDSLMEKIDIFLSLDDSIPSGMENEDYDSEGDVLFFEELLNDDSISLPDYESFQVDFYNVPSIPRPPKKPRDDDVYFDIEPDTRILTTKVVDDISDNSTRELYVHMPNVLPTLYPVFDTLLPFTSKNDDKVFNLGILISKEEKSPHFLSHRGFKGFQLINDSESP